MAQFFTGGLRALGPDAVIDHNMLRSSLAGAAETPPGSPSKALGFGTQECVPCVPRDNPDSKNTESKKPNLSIKPSSAFVIRCTCNEEPRKQPFIVKFVLRLLAMFFPNMGFGLPVCLGHG